MFIPKTRGCDPLIKVKIGNLGSCLFLNLFSFVNLRYNHCHLPNATDLNYSLIFHPIKSNHKRLLASDILKNLTHVATLLTCLLSSFAKPGTQKNLKDFQGLSGSMAELVFISESYVVPANGWSSCPVGRINVKEGSKSFFSSSSLPLVPSTRTRKILCLCMDPSHHPTPAPGLLLSGSHCGLYP